MSTKKILITGANGFLGGKITKFIIGNTDYDVLAIASAEGKILEMTEREEIEKKDRIQFLSNRDFLNPETELNDIYGAVHLAFARRVRPAADIAASLAYASDVFHKLAGCGVDRVINMSSQGIYGSTSEIRTEHTAPAPETHYTMAKYASEILFNDILKNAEHHTNFRLDLVAQSQKIINALCKQAREGKINLKGGKQVFSFIDGEDVGAAVVSMLVTNGTWNREYNIGWNRQRYTLVEVANIIANVAEKCGYSRPNIVLDEQDISLWAGMDSTRFSKRTGWEPKLTLENTVENILKI